MRLRFEDPDLERLAVDAGFRLPDLGPDVTTAYRKKVQLLAGARDERDLRAVTSLHFEKLRGARAGEHSIRLNQQWRLILRLERGDEGQAVIVVEIVDYH